MGAEIGHQDDLYLADGSNAPGEGHLDHVQPLRVFMPEIVPRDDRLFAQLVKLLQCRLEEQAGATCKYRDPGPGSVLEVATALGAARLAAAAVPADLTWNVALHDLAQLLHLVHQGPQVAYCADA